MRLDVSYVRHNVNLHDLWWNLGRSPRIRMNYFLYEEVCASMSGAQRIPTDVLFARTDQ